MRFARLAVVPAVLFSAACFQGQRLIKVNADGSGSVVDTVKLTAQAKGMLDGMEQMDKTSPKEKKAKKDAKLKAQTAAMGEGVTFVKAEPTKDGSERLTWSFKDVSKLKLDTSPTVSSGDANSSSDPLTFRFAKSGGSSVLTVVFAPPKPTDPSEKPKKSTPEEEAQGMAMMKGMMAGLKMTTAVEVNGKLVKTSSPYAAGSTVTLLEIDFDQIDEAGLNKLSGSDPSAPPSAELLKGVKGIKASSGEVTIEFAGK